MKLSLRNSINASSTYQRIYYYYKIYEYEELYIFVFCRLASNNDAEQL